MSWWHTRALDAMAVLLGRKVAVAPPQDSPQATFVIAPGTDPRAVKDGILEAIALAGHRRAVVTGAKPN